MSDLAEFYEFEREADRKVERLEIWKRPLRSVFSWIALTADVAFSGGRFGNMQSVDTDKGAAILSRLSFLMKHMKSCADGLGADIVDALNALADSDAPDIRSALQYGHFCELVPFVRNGYLQVEAIPDGFKLSHPSTMFAHDEQRDVVASEISLTMLKNSAPFKVPELTRMAESWPYLLHSDLNAVLDGAYRHYLDSVYEDDYLGIDSYRAAFGFDRDEFVRTRAALMAVASWCVGMSAAADALSQTTGSDDPDRWRKECLEWAVPALKKPLFVRIVSELSEIAIDVTELILRCFTEDPFGNRPLSGDGFLAPLTLVRDTYLFSPRTLIHMTVERNLIYVINRSDRDHYNNVVSQHLEPALLEQAERIFRSVPGLHIRKNVAWARGEIDMLVLDEASGSVLQIQAKAPIPPQGARMTRQVEQNTVKAVDQLKVVENLSLNDKRGIIRATFGIVGADFRWASAVLARSSFGTSRAWSSLDGRGALNLALLRVVVSNLRGHGTIDLTRIPAEASRILSELIQEASSGWEEGRFELFGKVIVFPNLRLDHGSLARFVEKSGRSRGW